MTQHDQPEYLDSRGGSPLPTGRGPRRSRRTVAVVIGGLAAVAVGGGAWAAFSFFSTGAQPAEALPASTIAYASIDLDPSGGQKIEALETLRKFPAFKDQVGLGTKDDVRKWVVEKVADEIGCDVDFGDDVEPWLGDRFAIAAVDAGKSEPAPLFVLQVTDEDAAEDGLATLRECGGGSADHTAWSIADGWALVGETQAVVDKAAADAADAPLSDDGDFQRWTDQAGDSGIVSLYAAPTAGKVLADAVDEGFNTALGLGLSQAAGAEGTPPGLTDAIEGQVGEMSAELGKFKGMAATLRFDDGGLELEVAADAGTSGSAVAGDAAGDAVSSLPSSTVGALALSFGDGWADDLLEQISGLSGQSADELVAQASAQLGIDLPDDAETLIGDALAIAVDKDSDPTAPQGIGVKILGDADDITGVLDKVRTAAAGQDGGFLDSDAADGAVAVGPDADYRKTLVEDGDLGSSDSFTRVVEHADDAAAVLYLDVDGAGDWLTGALDGDARDNLEPLDALGLSTWQDDDTVHAVLKIATD